MGGRLLASLHGGPTIGESIIVFYVQTNKHNNIQIETQCAVYVVVIIRRFMWHIIIVYIQYYTNSVFIAYTYLYVYVV